MTAPDAILDRLVRVAREARDNGYGSLSLEDKLCTALALNSAYTVAMLGYTIPEAIDRAGLECAARLLRVQRIIHADAAQAA